MTETKHEKFERMLATRLPKAVKSVELLANLSRKADYEYWAADVQTMLDQLDDAVDLVATSFGVAQAAPPRPAAGEHRGSSPGQTADAPAEARAGGGGRGQDLPTTGGQVQPDQRYEVRWAYDALRRGDKKLAMDRLERVLEVWIREERS